MVVREKADIDHIKKIWCAEPCWDIETTDGFEAHYDELLAYRHEREAEWEAERDRKRTKILTDLADTLGCPGNLQLAGYVDGLQRQLSEFQERLMHLEERRFF